MSRSKHTEAQIIGALKQVEARRSAEDVAREQGVSKHTIYAWKAKWAIDFASDVTDPGQRFRVLGVIDGFTGQSHLLETSTSFPSRRVTRELERAIATHGKPQAIRCDNGPELTSRHFLAWAIEWKIDIVHIQPGKPTQNGGMESFNGKLRDECLNANWFWNLFDVRRKISDWKTEYNSRRPHSSLGYLTPDEFARQWKAASLSGEESMAVDRPRQGNPDGLSLAHDMSGGISE